MDYRRNWLKRNPENFPIASWLLPAQAHEPIMAFYAFARGADEIADAHRISPERRRRDLVNIEEALLTHNDAMLPEFAKAFSRLAKAHPPLLTYARDLLSAFVQDTQKTRYHDYNDLHDYCQRSAAPVGRVYLYICGEHTADKLASDALCNALQLLNHIQDCADDYVKRDRVYLPLDWFEFAGSNVKMLASSSSTRSLRMVIDRGLDNCETLLTKAKPLIASIQDERVRKEVVWIYSMAQSLYEKLRKRDPLAEEVKVGKLQTIRNLTHAILRG